MKEELLKLLQANPATAGRSDDFLDALAEDIQALIIRALVPGNTDDVAAVLEQRVIDVYNDHFGVKLSNLFMLEPFDGKRKLYYSGRMRVVKAMIQAMLLEQDENFDREPQPETTGDMLRRRLEELTPGKQLVN